MQCVCVNVVQCYNAGKRYVYSMHAEDCSMRYEYPSVSLCSVTVHCISIFCLMIFSFQILNQDMAKTFLFSCDPHKLYEFFMRATMLEDCKENYNYASNRSERVPIATYKKRT